MTLRPTDIDYSAPVVAERLWTGGNWIEGPCWLPVEQQLLFSDVVAGTQYTLDPATRKVTVFRHCSNYGNGSTLDATPANLRSYYGFYPPELQAEADYVVLTCEHGRRAVSASLPPHALERYYAKYGPQGAPRPAAGGGLHTEDGDTEATALLPPHTVITNKVVTQKFLGDMRYNSPNDIVVREQDGSVWFTDPSYGIQSNKEGYTAPSQYSNCFVFAVYPLHLCHVVRHTVGGRDVTEETRRRATAGVGGGVNSNQLWCHHEALQARRIQVQDCVRPNGLAFSPDGSVLYVADSCCIDFADRAGTPEIRAYDVVLADAPVEETREVRNKEGDVVESVTLRYRPWRAVNGRTHCLIRPGVPDGFRVDGNGYIFTSSEHAIVVFDPSGREVNRVEVPERTSNCSFGGPHGRDLFVSGNTSVYRISFPAKK